MKTKRNVCWRVVTGEVKALSFRWGMRPDLPAVCSASRRAQNQAWPRSHCPAPGLFLLFQPTTVIVFEVLAHVVAFSFTLHQNSEKSKRQYSSVEGVKKKRERELVNLLWSNFTCFCCDLKSIILTSWHWVRSASVYFVLTRTGKLDPEVKRSFLFSEVV